MSIPPVGQTAAVGTDDQERALIPSTGRCVIGPDGTGRTTTLEAWAGEIGAPVIRCRADGTHDPALPEDGDGPLAVDDAHHAPAELLASEDKRVVEFLEAERIDGDPGARATTGLAP